MAEKRTLAGMRSRNHSSVRARESKARISNFHGKEKSVHKPSSTDDSEDGT